MVQLSAPPKFLILERQYTLPESEVLTKFYITEITFNPESKVKKIAVPAGGVEELLKDMTEQHDFSVYQALRYAVLMDPRVGGKRDDPLTTGWDSFSQPLLPNLSVVKNKWKKDSMVIMTFATIAQPLANALNGQIVYPKD